VTGVFEESTMGNSGNAGGGSSFQLIDANVADGFRVDTAGMIFFNSEDYYRCDTQATHSVNVHGGAASLNVDAGDRVVYVSGTYSAIVDTDYDWTVGGNHTTTVTGNQTDTVTGDITITSNKWKQTATGESWKTTVGHSNQAHLSNTFKVGIGMVEEISLSGLLALKLGLEASINIAATMKLNVGAVMDYTAATKISGTAGLDIKLKAATEVDITGPSTVDAAANRVKLAGGSDLTIGLVKLFV
jgi:hypothetical protein